MKKKILSLLTAFAMVFGILVAPFTTASASNGNELAGKMPTKTSGTFKDSDISTTVPDVTKVTIRKIKADSFNITEGIEHNGGEIAENDLKMLGKTVEGLDGVKFTYYKVSKEQFDTMKKSPKDYTTKDQVEKKYDDLANKGTETQETANGGYVSVNINKPANPNEIEYYWFVESAYNKKGNGPDAISSSIAVPFGITIPMTNVTKITIGSKTYDPGTVWLKNVYTYPKNVTGNEPEPKKTVGNEKNMSETHKVGEEQTWYLQATIPANIKDYESFTMRDVFFKGLTYKGLEEVYVGYDGIEDNDKIKLTANTDYTAVQPDIDKKFTTEIPNPVKVPDTVTGEELKITVKEGTEQDKNGIVKIAEQYEELKKKADAKNEEVKLYAKVKTVINEDAKVSGNIPNSYELKFKIKGKDESKPKEPGDKPFVKTGGKKFKKIDGADQKALENAIFTIKHQKDGTKPADTTAWNAVEDLKWTQALIDANKKEIEAGKFAVKDANNEEYKATSSTVSPEVGKPIYLRSSEDGTFEIKGLEYSDYTINKWDSTKKTFVADTHVMNYYALKEVKAPADYALLDKEFEFTIDDTSYYEDATQVEPKAADPKLVNNKKLTIPQTGGIGSLVFIAAGLAIMTFAFVSYRKSQAKEA